MIRHQHILNTAERLLAAVLPGVWSGHAILASVMPLPRRIHACGQPSTEIHGESRELSGYRTKAFGFDSAQG